MSWGYICTLLIIVSICLLLFQNKGTLGLSEGFDSADAAKVVTLPSLIKADPTSDYTQFRTHAQKVFNPIGIASKGLNSSLVPASASRATFGVLVTAQEGFEDGTHMVLSDPFPQEDMQSGLFKIRDTCEKVTSSDSCSVFDDTAFNTDCGICLDIGVNSLGKPATGGLILVANDKTDARANKTSDFLPNYKPSYNLGTCPSGKFVSNKDECLRLKAQMKCAQSGAIDSATGCSQCYDDTSYSVVNQDPSASLVAGAGTIYVVGSGNLQFSEVGQSNSGSINLSSTPYAIKLFGSEGGVVNLNLLAIPQAMPYDSAQTYKIGDSIIFNTGIYRMREGAGGPGYAPDIPGDKLWTLVGSVQDYVPPPPPSMAGYLTGSTGPSKTFNFDLYRLVVTDTVTGRKPRATGSTNISGVDSTTMSPGYGQKAMNLQLKIVFTFVDQFTQEASLCSSSPYVTKAASATFLGGDPCYTKGASTPGNYNLQCLQNTFLSNGCSESGTGYPSAKNAGSLLLDSTGAARNLSKIAEIIYAKAVLAATGVDVTGTKVDIPTWSSASQWCSGVTVTSPCDVMAGKYNVSSGPLSPDCLTYLWDNLGQDSQLGQTYSASSSAYSSLGKTSGSTFCTRSGTLSPSTSTGAVNSTALAYWNKFGSLMSTRAEMTRIHAIANGPGANAQKINELMQCYGITVTTSLQNAVTSKFVPATTNEGFHSRKEGFFGGITLSGPSSVEVGAYFEMKSTGASGTSPMWTQDGVKNGGCMSSAGCGFYAPKTGTQTVIGLSSQGLSGSFTINLTQPAPITDMGCWNDSSIRALNGGPYKYGYTKDACAAEAKKLSSTIFALQDGDDKSGWCAVAKPNDDYKKWGKGPDNCKVGGGGWLNHVYSTAPPPPPPPPPPKYNGSGPGRNI